MKKNLAIHLKKHPLATEEDIVKFVFQGMLGVGHLVSSHQKTLAYIAQEMDSIQADDKEPLIEKLSTFWARMNARIICYNKKKKSCRSTRSGVMMKKRYVGWKNIQNRWRETKMVF